MKYVLKRNPVRYANGEMSPVAYYSESILGLTILTFHISDAKVFPNKSAAVKANRNFGNEYEIAKLE